LANKVGSFAGDSMRKDVFDPAKAVWHITKSPADFGQTLGKWGIGPGPYLVLPFMEPLTAPDGIGKVIDRSAREHRCLDGA
jgi:ABC-type transporter lipoprotein component MlaA